MNGETRRQSWDERWGAAIARVAERAMEGADPGHGIEHVQRVVQNAIQLSRNTDARWEIVLPAAWLHDCVSVPKNSPQRAMASRLAAAKSLELLDSLDYPPDWRQPIAHCIEAHSFSAGIPCQTLEARIVQDADRLEALGAIGIARCLMTGGAMGQRLYEPSEPFPVHRPPKDTEQSIDHFFAKLLGLSGTMQTEAGRREAVERTDFLVTFLERLGTEIGADREALQSAIAHAREKGK
jgi:uncharacterized protein